MKKIEIVLPMSNFNGNMAGFDFINSRCVREVPEMTVAIERQIIRFRGAYPAMALTITDLTPITPVPIDHTHKQKQVKAKREESV